MLIESVRDFGKIEEIKKEWNKILFSSKENNIFLTYEWFSSWWKCFSKGKNLEILLVKENKELVGIAPLMIENGIVKFIANHEVSDYCDFIVSIQKKEIFYKSILNYFKNYPKLELINIRESSPTLKFLLKFSDKYNFVCKSYEIEKAPYLILPSSYEEYLKKLSSKNRHELKRKLRRAELLKDLKIRKINNFNELQSSIKIFIDFHKNSSPKKSSFWKNNTYCFFIEICKQFALRKWIELYFLIHKERIISSLLSFTYFSTIYLFNSAYDKNFSQYSPGVYLFNYKIRKAISENKNEIDFLRGEEKYKYNFGAIARKLYKLVLHLKEK